MLQVRAADGGRALGAKCEKVAAAVLEGVGLFLDDVGGGAYSPLEQPGVLEHGRVYAVVAEPDGDLLGGGSDEAPVGFVFGQHVGRASWGLELQRKTPCF